MSFKLPANNTPVYRGRFAPSPTGPLHFGSLVAAVGSFLDARSRGGEWLVRMEDLDLTRVVAGAADDILHTLEAFGFYWDGAVMFQSERNEAYRAAMNELEKIGAVYPCACTRKEIADSAIDGIDGPVYPGTCRGGLLPGRDGRAVRVCTDSVPIGVDSDNSNDESTCNNRVSGRYYSSGRNRVINVVVGLYSAIINDN